MKKNIFFIFLVFSVCCNVFAQSYDSLWKDYRKFQEKDLPKSQIEVLTKIYNQAKDEGQFGELLKAYTQRMGVRVSLDRELWMDDLNRLNSLFEAESNVVNKSLLAYELASNLILPFLSHFDRKEDNMFLSDKNDFRFWTSKQIKDKQIELLKFSVQNRTALANAKAKTYLPYLSFSGAKELKNHSLLLYLVIKVTRTLESIITYGNQSNDRTLIDEIYSENLEFFKQNNKTSSYVYLLGSYYSRNLPYFANSTSDESLEKDLDLKIKAYQQFDTSCELYKLKINYDIRNRKYEAALRACDKAIRLYPNYADINKIKRLRESIIKPYLSLQMKSQVNTYDSVSFKVRYKNLKKFKLEVTSGEDYSSTYSYQLEENIGKSIKDVDFKFPAVPFGRYSIKLIPVGKENAEPDTASFVSSNLFAWSIITFKKDCSTIVLDSKDGKVVPNAIVDLYKNGKFFKSLSTNNDGEVSYKYDKRLTIKVRKGEDKYASAWSVNYKYIFSNSEVQHNVQLFIDRHVFKPGQKVLLKGVLSLNHLVYNKDKNELLTLELRDPNYNLISQEQITLNEMGSFYKELDIPENCLRGRYTISVNNTSVGFSVEDYKRPEFKIEVDSLASRYVFGDTLHVNGKVTNIIDNSLNNIPVQLQVRYGSNYADFGKENFSTTTTKDGSFHFQIPLLKGINVVESAHAQLSIKANTKRSKILEKSLYVSYGVQSFRLQLEGYQSKYNKDSLVNLKVLSTNNNGFVPSRGKLEILSLDKKKVLYTKDLVSGQSQSYDFSSLLAGKHYLRVTAKNERNKAVTISKKIDLYSFTEKEVEENNELWCPFGEVNYDNHNEARVLVGTSFRDAYVRYDVFSTKGHIKSGYLKLDKELKIFKLRKDDYEKGLTYHFTLLKQGRFYHQEVRVHRPDKKNLVIKWKTFRNKLLPGQDEKWTLNVSYPDGRSANAEILAYMYDSSLDLFSYTDVNWNKIQSTVYGRWSGYSGHTINLFGINRFSSPMMIRGFHYIQEEAEDEPVMTRTVKTKNNGNVSKVRDNFSETAFFYPFLRTNRRGTVSFKFKLPESLTKWKLMLFAHDKNMNTAKLEEEVIAKKDFMLKAFVPKYIRKGNQLNVTVDVTNLKDYKIDGEVSLELFDVKTQEVLCIHTLPFAIEANSSEKYSFPLSSNNQEEQIGCRFMAKSKNFTDGEQYAIPVLSNEEYISESIPFFIRAKQDSLYRFDSLSKSLNNDNVELEMMLYNNPAYFAMLQLPQLKNNAESDLATELLNSFYINSVVKKIIENHPKLIKRLKSEVSKNSEGIKNEKYLGSQEIITAEMPWSSKVKATDKVVKLLTKTTSFELKLKLDYLFNKLSELQQKDGGLSWCSGMTSNNNVSIQAFDIFIKSILFDSEAAEKYEPFLSKLYVYVSKLLSSELKEAQEKNTLLSFKGLQSLNLILSYNKLYKTNTYADLDKAISKLKTQKVSQSIAYKAYLIDILAKTSFKDDAAQNAKSIVQYLQPSSSFDGLYLPNKSIRDQILTINALSLFSEYEKQVAEMKTWLAFQTILSSSMSDKNRLNTSYLLLKNYSGDEGNTNQIEFSWGNKKWKLPENKSFKLSYNKPFDKNKVELQKMLSTPIKIKSGSDIPFWGAMKLNYTVPLKSVSNSSSTVSISRIFYKITQKDGKDLYAKVEDGAVLKVGDEVVSRLEIKNEEPINFVEVIEQKAACLESIKRQSGFRFGTYLSYYFSLKDASISYFVEELSKGVFILENKYYITRKGQYTLGIAKLQSTNNPEFTSNSTSINIVVE